MTPDDLELEELRAIDPRIVDPATLWRVGAAHVWGWNHRGRPEADPDELFFMGDDGIEMTVRHVIERVPCPVRTFAIENVAFFGVGHSSAGWQFDLPDFGGRTNVVNLSRANSGLVAHELAHAWQLGHVPGRRPRNAAASKEILRLLSECPKEFRRELVSMESETDEMADAAARAWGFPFDASTGLVEHRLREIDGVNDADCR